MYQISDKVVHKVHGICQITDIVKFSYSEDSFYKICPDNDIKLAIYVPVSKCEGIIRPLISKDEADNLILYMKDIDNSIVEDSKGRRDEYAKMLNTGSIRDIAFLAKKLYLLKNEKIRNNRSIGLIDQDTFNKANTMLISELSIVYGVSAEEIESMLSKTL